MDSDAAETLRRLYLALSPPAPRLIASPPFPTAAQIALESVQTWLVERLLDSEQLEGGNRWRLAFWKRVVALAEDAVRAAFPGLCSERAGH